jgi:hypothetical protein
MEKIERWDTVGHDFDHEPCADGDWVTYEDHERIVREAYQQGFDNGYQRGRDKEDYINNPTGS